MPQTLLSLGCADLKQVTAAAAAVAAYEASWGYAEEQSTAPGRKPSAASHTAVPAELGLEDFKERLADLVTAQRAVAAAAAAVDDYSAAMAYAEAGRAEHKAGTAAGSVLEREELAQRLEELVRQAQSALCAAAAVVVPDWCQYAEPDAVARCGTAYTSAPLELADLAERLTELTKCTATAVVPDWCQYAEPGQAQGSMDFSPAPLELADLAERLAELTKCTATAVVPDWCQYAEPGAAARCGTAFSPAPLELADMAARLVELTA